MFSALKSVVDVVLQLHHRARGYTCIVVLRLSADFGVSPLNYFLLNSRHPSY